MKHPSDEIINQIFNPKSKVEESLQEIYDQRLENLKTNTTSALKLMGMSVRTLNGILTGEQKVLDYTQLIKLANFLDLELNQVAKLYLEKVNEVHAVDPELRRNTEAIEFINNHFDLGELRKVGLIKSITDYKSIIDSITNYFGLKDIFDYQIETSEFAFSSGKRAKSNSSLQNWKFMAKQTCIELRNNYNYDRQMLIDYFPQIRWNTLDVDNGLVRVVNQLF